MSEYKEIITSITDKLLQFVKKYEQLDNHEPFSFAITDALKKQIKIFNTAASDIDTAFGLQKQTAEKSVNVLLQNYNKREKQLDKKLLEDINEIQEKYRIQSNTLTLEINKAKTKVQDDEALLLQDVEWFKSASDQNIDMFEHEYEESMSRYDYHHNVAMESYSQNTIINNNNLELEIAERNKEFSEVLVDFDRQTKSIIENYQKNIDKKLMRQKEAQEAQEKVEIEHKEHDRDESVKLNDKIRSLVSIRNNNIANSKAEYAKKQNEANLEKEEKRQNYQAETQKLSRLFVINMGQLDDKITELKNNYNLNTDMEKRNLYYRLLELKKEQEKELEGIFAQSNPKLAKRQSKSINRSYFRYSTIEMVNNQRTLDNLLYGFNFATEENNYDRKLLEIDRSYSIKHFIEEENRDNKYYQEMNNLFEIDMNLEIATENLEYSREANRIRFENNLKSIVEEKEFDEKQASYQIENEKHSCDIKIIRNEINSLSEIKDLLHSKEEKIYKTDLNFKVVNNTLQIEKDKVLDNFNTALYELNAKSARLILELSKDQTYKKNDQYEAQNTAKIKKSYMMLNSEEKDVEYQLETFKRNEALEIKVIKRNYYFELDKLGHNLLSKKWLVEIKELHQCLSAFIQILKEMEFMGVEASNTIFKNIVFRPGNVKIVWIFMKEFLTIIYNSLKDLIDTFKNYVHALIESRLETEDKLKFKGFYKNLESQYQESMNELNILKTAAMSDVEKYQSMIENNNNAIFSIDNDLFLKKKMAYGTKEYKDALAEASIQKKDINADTQKLTKILAGYKKHANSIQQKILDLDKSYSRQQDDIRSMQLTNAKCYFTLKRDVEKYAVGFISEMYSKVHLNDVPETEMANYEALVAQRADTFISMNEELFIGFEKILNDFRIGEKSAIKTSSSILQSSYNTDILEIRKAAFIEDNEAKDTFAEESKARADEIRRFDVETQLQENHLKKEIQSIDTRIKNLSDDIQKEREQITNVFYEEYYAICDNQADVIQKHEKDKQRFEKEFEEKRQKINEKFANRKIQLNVAFEEYKEKKEEDIKNLPSRVKDRQKQMKEDTHTKNLEIDESIIQAKLKAAAERKDTNRNLLGINSAFEAKEQEIEKEKKTVIAKEKKKYALAIKRL